GGADAQRYWRPLIRHWRTVRWASAAHDRRSGVVSGVAAPPLRTGATDKKLLCNDPRPVTLGPVVRESSLRGEKSFSRWTRLIRAAALHARRVTSRAEGYSPPGAPGLPSRDSNRGVDHAARARVVNRAKESLM